MDCSIIRRIVAITLALCMTAGSVQSTVNAEETTGADSVVTIPKVEENGDKSDVVIGITEGNVRTVNDVIAQSKFSQNTGHGYAAERGNNLIDRIKGNNAIVVGDDNVKNGPDRLILNRDGSAVLIQDKYYQDANSSIDACFDSKGYRYIDADGNLMQVEVPKDQYEAAVLRMEEKIKAGQVPGVSDPGEAKSIVRKGNLTYEQAKNLAKAGTIESLEYDAINGVISAGGAFGISTVLNYAVLRVNGEPKDKAIKESAIAGVKTGIGVFCTAVIAGQLSKTGIMNVFKPSSEALTKALGEEFSKKLLKAYGQQVLAVEGKSTAESATKQAAKLLRSNVLVAVVTTIVFSVPDAVDMFRGRISKKQFIKNFAVTAASVVGGTVGAGVGGALGNALAPGAGTVPGNLLGGIVGGFGSGFVADKLADRLANDDAEEMYAILEERFSELCEDYLLNEDEAAKVADSLGSELTENVFKEMYKSKDRKQYASDLLIPLFEETVLMRETIEMPSEEEMRTALKEELQGVVFVH